LDIRIFAYASKNMKPLENSVIKIAEIIKSLGHPLRIEILRLLINSRTHSLSVKQIQERLEITQPETSKHLIVMRNQAILLCEKKDGHSYYRINEQFSFIHGILNYLRRNRG
jgi:DNA-binding transcriptional ArsR family regulator